MVLSSENMIATAKPKNINVNVKILANTVLIKIILIKSSTPLILNFLSKSRYITPLLYLVSLSTVSVFYDALRLLLICIFMLIHL
jgi:hypothetical protein